MAGNTSGKRFAQDFNKIDKIKGNDALMVQDSGDGVVKYATPSQILSYIVENTDYAERVAVEEVAAKADRIAEDVAHIAEDVAQTKMDIIGKQDTITLEVLDNGTIRLGNIAGQTKDFMPATPSGDPMHYAYEAVGAEYNADTGFWEMYGLTDITNEEMRAAYIRGYWDVNEKNPFCVGDSFENVDQTSQNYIRFSLPRKGFDLSDARTNNGEYFATANDKIEVINLSTEKIGLYVCPLVFQTSMDYAFAWCWSLRKIIGPFQGDGEAMFEECSALEDFQWYRVNFDIDLSWLDNISAASVAYIINNCGPDLTTINLSSEAGERVWDDVEVQNALRDKEMQGQYIDILT